jgi:hypothetical protein
MDRTYLVVPRANMVVSGALNGLNGVVSNEADEALNYAVFVGACFVAAEEVDEANVCGSDAEEENLGCVMRSVEVNIKVG